MPGFLISALAGVAAAMLAALLSPRRRGGWAWTLLVGLIGGAASGVALYELGAGAVGGAETLYAPADERAFNAYAAGGALGGVCLIVIHQTLRSIVFQPRQPVSPRARAAQLKSLATAASDRISQKIAAAKERARQPDDPDRQA